MATEARDFIKVRTNELLTDKNEEIVLHNDVIRSTTLYDETGAFKIKQNEVPVLGRRTSKEEKSDEDFWKETDRKVQVDSDESVKKPESDEDVHFI